MRKSAVIRIRIITGAVLAFALLLMLRLYQVQVLQHDAYVARAEQQYVHTVADLFSRGNIFFTTKAGEKVSAATVQAGYVLAVDPTKLADAAAAYEMLAGYIDTDRETFLERATLPGRTYVVIDEQVSGEDADAITMLDLAGVALYKNQ